MQFCILIGQTFKKLLNWKTWDGVDFSNVKTKMEILSNFVAFSESINFKYESIEE